MICCHAPPSSFTQRVASSDTVPKYLLMHCSKDNVAVEIPFKLIVGETSQLSDAIFFLLYADAMGISEQDAIYISNLIYFHMHPFMSWDKSEKSRDKAIKSIGQKMYNDIMELHVADLAAH